MELAIRRKLVFRSPHVEVFDSVTAVHNLTTFVGFGPIPGIAEAEHAGPITEGSELRILNTDGSRHVERVEVLDPPTRYRIRIGGFDSPFRFLIDHATEQLDFHARDGGTTVEREFRFTLTSPLAAPLAAPLLHLFFARALDRNYERLRDLIDGGAGATHASG